MDSFSVTANIQLVSLPFCEVRLSVSYKKNELPEKTDILVPIWPHKFATFISEEVAEIDAIHYEAGLQKSFEVDTHNMRTHLQTLVEQLFPHGYYNTSGGWTGMFCLLSFDLVFRFEILMAELPRTKLDIKLYAHSQSGAVSEAKLNALLTILLTNYEYLLTNKDSRN